MKPTQRQQLIDLFIRYGYKVTLGQLLQTTLAAEYRARITELRQDGWTIICEKGKSASENTYRAMPPEEDGQMRMAI